MNALQIEDQAERARAFLDQAAALAPILDGRARATEEAGQMLPGTMADLRAGGFTRLCQPRKFGGGELPLDAAAEVIAALAQGCGSTAWVCAVYTDHSILSGTEVGIAFATGNEAGIFESIRSKVPEVTAAHLSEGSVLYHLIVQIDKKQEGCQRRAIEAAFEAGTFLKMVTVVDTDVDIFDMGDVEWAVATRARFEQDLILIPDAIGHRINPMVEDDRWTRLGIDATVPLPRAEKFRRATMRDVDLENFRFKGL